MEVKVEKFQPMKTASVRHVGPYEQVTAAWMGLLMSPCVMPMINESTMYIGVCYDDPAKVEASQLRYDACVSAVEGFTPLAPIVETVIDGGEYAVCRHLGSYKNMTETIMYVYEKWMAESGRKPKSGGALVQIYRNLPINTPEEKLITDICVPLA